MPRTYGKRLKSTGITSSSNPKTMFQQIKKFFWSYFIEDLCTNRGCYEALAETEEHDHFEKVCQECGQIYMRNPWGDLTRGRTIEEERAFLKSHLRHCKNRVEDLEDKEDTLQRASFQSKAQDWKEKLENLEKLEEKHA